ncbi:MFS transporter [Pseudoxanthomonas composti]|uniref:MFS transporter n=1 Tax=Pseudoxanthomonas composti TaxID=2137479 RepID=UPI0013E97769|nr:MFS transporter [Pseudoxanthomonas composti]
MLTAYTLAFIDRQLISLLVQPIKHDLDLSDTQFGLLAGFAFALFYVGVGLLMGHASDRVNRRNLILLGMALWVSATAATAWASGFWTLALTRALVAIGEATLNPAALSMLADAFPAHQRARAVGAYSTGAFIGAGLALILGGALMHATQQTAWIELPLLGGFRPWQAAFLLAALPGLVALPLMWCVSEPGRAAQRTCAPQHASAERPDGKDRRLVLACVIGGFALLAMTSYGTMVWLPAAFIRTWGWTTAEAGLTYGLLLLSFGIAGMLAAGWITDRSTSRGHRQAALALSCTCGWLLLPGAVGLMLARSAAMAVAAAAVITLLVGMVVSLTSTTVLAIAPARSRGKLIAITMLAVNLVGLGLGPAAVAVFTDGLFADEGKVHLSIGLLIVLSAVGGTAALGVAVSRGGEQRRPLRAPS